MKKVVLLLVLITGGLTNAQSVDYNTKKGYVAGGYDVVAYFEGQALEGDKIFGTSYDGVKYKFASQVNLDKFKGNPKRYVPQYGGYCAYAVAVSGKKVNINPKTFEIREDQLLLFYNSGKTNTLKLWQNESPNELKVKADKNWGKIKNK